MKKLTNAIKFFNFLADRSSDIEIFGMFGPGNLGDEAMLIAALANLPQRRAIPWPSFAFRRGFDALIRVRRRRHLLVGGGTLIHGGDAEWLDYIEMRSKQGIQVSFFGTGISFTPDEINNQTEPYRRWCDVLKNSTDVHLRGPYSVDICNKMGNRSDIFGDFAFLLYDPSIPNLNHSTRRNTIGLKFGQCLGDQIDFESRSIDLVKRLSKSHNLTFYTVVDTDIDATRRIIECSGISEDNYTTENHFYDPVSFMRSVKNLSAFIGLKLHAAGLAMVAGVPSIMIAYKDKSFDFMAPLVAGDHMLVGLPLNVDEVVQKLNDLFESPHEYVFIKEIEKISVSQRAMLSKLYDHGSL